MTTNQISARDVAALVLARVWRDGAYAAPTLDAELRRAGLEPRDGRLVTELTYGVLRTERVLHEAIARHANSPKWKKQPRVRAHLCIAAYSIFFLDRVPNFAAVSEAVSALRRGADKRVALCKHATGNRRMWC